jgi:hypothetical protein
MQMRIIVALCAMLAATNGASAAIWEWGCQAQVGGQQVIFNRTSMVIVDTKVKMGDIRKLRMSELDLPAGSPPSVKYEPDDASSGLEKTMSFMRKDDAKRKLTLTEKSSQRMSRRHKLICGRDEDEDIFRKVYRYQRDDEPARDITMQCLEYQLSTLGERKGCGDD